MKEALKALCEYAFNFMGLHRIEANIMPWNKASLAVAKSCGFAEEGSSLCYLNINGRWEEHVHMVLLNEKNIKRMKSALIIIDMQNGFVCKESALCIKHASETLPVIASCIEEARAEGMPVFYIMRIYREDGSDVELCRYDVWKNNGMVLSPSAKGADSCEICSEIAPKPGDYVIYKPRWSAFFQTQLDMVLRRLKIENIYLTGTTTPNCIRTTAYDALALDYNTVVIEDCCSSQSSEIQKANMDDMQRVGVKIISSADFCRQ